MKKLVVALSVSALFAAVAIHTTQADTPRTPLPAPIVCHGCPDRATYNFVDEIQFWLHQCHWSAKGSNLFGDRLDLVGFNPNGTVLDPAHVHLELADARYAERDHAWRIDFRVVLRDFRGTFGIWGAAPFKPDTHDDDATEWWWDDTQSSVAPLMFGGDANKTIVMVDAFGRDTRVQTYTGHFTAHPRHLFIGKQFHGFDVIAMSGQATFTNGDLLQVAALTSYWNNVDPTAAITMTSQGPADEPFMGTNCSPIAIGSGELLGDNELFFHNYLPTAPFAGKWELPATRTERDSGFVTGPVTFANAYGGEDVQMVKGSNQTRNDANLHMGIPGTIVQRVDQAGGVNVLSLIDNTGLAVGPHNKLLFHAQPDNIPTNAATSLLVIPVAVPDGTVVTPPPPPPVCVPPAVLTNGQCVTPIVTPPPPVVLPTIVKAETCQTVTMSDGSVTSQCVHVP